MIALYRSVAELVDSFDALLLDLWGVVHDGIAPYPGVIETFHELRARNKKIVLISNAPRKSHKAVAVLESMGIVADFYDGIITSGDITRMTAHRFGQRYFYIGPERDDDLLTEDGFIATQPQEADFALVTGFDDDDDTIADVMPLIEQARAANLLMLCANPDKIVVRQSGEELPCAGLIAEEYERLGGKVQYFGKPYPEIYHHALEMLGNIPKPRIAAIGDSLSTDIKGAQSMGIRAIFCTGGIHAKELRTAYGRLPSEEALLSFCRSKGIIPDGAIAGFTFAGR